MNKGDLVDTLASAIDISKADANTALNTVLSTIEKALKKGDKVTLIGFGTFSVNKRPARTGRNPQTGETIKIKAKKVVKFKPGKALSESIA